MNEIRKITLNYELILPIKVEINDTARQIDRHFIALCEGYVLLSRKLHNPDIGFRCAYHKILYIISTFIPKKNITNFY